MFRHKQTEFLAISMKYFFDSANILEVKTYNNTLLTNKTKEFIYCVIVSAKRINLKQMQFLGMSMHYAVAMIMLRYKSDATQ